MKINKVQFAVLPVILILAGVMIYGLFERLSPSHMNRETIPNSVSVNESLYNVADSEEENAKKIKENSSEEELRKNINTLSQQVSVLAGNVEILHDQINVLFARINTEAVVGEEVEKETIDNSIAMDNLPDESSANLPSMRYTNEIRDDQWASSAEVTIAKEFTTNPKVAGVAIDSIDCRSSLCHLVWQYKPDMTNEEAFATENEMLAAINRAGFNASSQSTLGGGLNEGYFWYNPPPEVAPESNPSALLGGGR